jgi:hypothetical protein
MNKIVVNRLRFLRRIRDFMPDSFNTCEKNNGLLPLSPPNIMDGQHKH